MSKQSIQKVGFISLHVIAIFGQVMHNRFDRIPFHFQGLKREVFGK